MLSPGLQERRLGRGLEWWSHTGGTSRSRAGQEVGGCPELQGRRPAMPYSSWGYRLNVASGVGFRVKMNNVDRYGARRFGIVHLENEDGLKRQVWNDTTYRMHSTVCQGHHLFHNVLIQNRLGDYLYLNILEWDR